MPNCGRLNAPWTGPTRWKGCWSPKSVTSAKTDLAVRRATFQEIELEMQRLTLRAPHGGIVVEIMAREGELLEDSVAMRIVELSRLLVEADMPLGRFGSFEPGQILRLETETGGRGRGAHHLCRSAGRSCQPILSDPGGTGQSRRIFHTGHDLRVAGVNASAALPLLRMIGCRSAPWALVCKTTLLRTLAGLAPSFAGSAGANLRFWAVVLRLQLRWVFTEK